MPSERIQRQIDRLLDEAEQSAVQQDWPSLRDLAQQILAFDPENDDARGFLSAAKRMLDLPPASPSSLIHLGGDQGAGSPDQPLPAESSGSAGILLAPVVPISFANGRYQVKRFQGEGGKKRVYLAHDTLLDRDVAFALIKTEGLDDTGRDRIRREAQAMGRLGSHPHIVSVYDLGEEADGQPYIVTELMGGGDVEALIEKAPEHRPPLEQSLEIGIQVCRGLEFAHAHGIVHRDLKPGNVWLTADGTAKLGDFGLAVALDRSRLTQAGMMVGTVSYMPPEQAMGGEVTPRSDLYSLGAMLYEMVTGRPPFVGDESVAIITQHLNTAPVSPSWHNPETPPALETLILRLLEKEPAKRPASAGEVREALHSIASHPTIPALFPDESREELADNPLYRRTFVGRETELRQLQTAYDAATSGQGSLAVVVGEPGIGKTSLTEQLATYATIRGGKTLVGHCYEEGSLSLPYLPFVEAMRSYVLAREPEGLRKDLGSGATEVARIVSELRERLHVEPSPPNPADAEEERYRLFQAVCSFLRNAAAVQPLVIVLEDLHDADRGTLDLLLHLSRNLAGARLLIVGTYRDIEVDRAHPLSSTLAELRRSANFSRVLLRGLTADEVQRMMSSIGGQEVRWETAEAVHRQTEGNPLFVQEVLRYLVEEGLITREGGRWRPTGQTPLAMSIPEGLRDVIGKRLSRLSPECNRLLSVAAVVGRDFRLDTLRTVAGVTEDSLVLAMEEATRVAVLQEEARVGGVQYRFAHAFFRQTLYEELSAPRRLRMHQEVARALEGQYATRLEEHAAELAEHFAQSTDPEDLRKAIHYSELAAQRALAVYAYGEAVRHLEQALDVQEVLDPDDMAKRCDLLLELGEALVSAGETTRAIDIVVPGAFSFAEQLSDRRRALRSCRIVHRAMGWSSQAFASEGGQKWAQRADQYAQEGSIDRVYADVFMAYTCSLRGESELTLSLLRKATQLALRLDDGPALAVASSFLVSGQSTPPEGHEERISLADELSKRSLEGARNGGLANTLLSISTAYLTWGRRGDAEEQWERAKAVALRSHDAEAAFVPLQIDALVQTLDGQLRQAAEIGVRIEARGLEVDRATEGKQTGSRAARRALVYMGRPDDALARILDLPELFANGGVFSAQRALCLAHLGRVDEAEDLLHRMTDARDMSSHEDPTPVSVLKYLLETAVLLKDADACRILGGRLAQMADLLHTEADMCYNIGRLCGGAAALLGEPEKARGYYEQALVACEKIRFRPEIALTRLELAELLLAHYPDERVVAIDHLDFAIAEFREMKMQPSLERALRHKEVLKA